MVLYGSFVFKMSWIISLFALVFLHSSLLAFTLSYVYGRVHLHVQDGVARGGGCRMIESLDIHCWAESLTT